MSLSHDCHPDGEGMAHALDLWLQTAVGASLVRDVKAVLEPLLSEYFGYYALQIGWNSDVVDLLESSRIKHRLRLGYGSENVDARVDPVALPIQGDSVDLAMVVFGLEFADDPHQLLREVDRILIPEGHVLIVGFNPFSAMGLWKLALGWKKSVPWCGRFYSGARVRDWLGLLGLEALSTTRIAYRPPFRSPRLHRWLSVLERIGPFLLPVLGGCHVIVARKRLATVTPIRPRWRSRRGLIPGDLAEPTAREAEYGRAD